MDTQNLKAFQAVAEQGSFSAAAEELHLTQPAVSKRIATLEEQLHCRLFDRIGRTVTLTEAGRALLPKARHILLEVADTQRLIADLSGQVSGRLSLATSHHVGLHRLPAVLRQFTRQYPEVALELDFLDSEKAYDAVLHGRFELAVITLAPAQDRMLLSHTIWQDPLRFVVAPDHPLLRLPADVCQHASTHTTQSPRPLTLEDLALYPAILPDLNTYTTALVKSLFDRRGLALHLTMATNYLETIKMMVSIGLGWSVLPDTMIDAQVAPLNISGLKIARQLGCIYHRERSLSNAAQAFLCALRQQSVNSE